MKKLFSSFLIFTFLLSFFPTPSFAQEETREIPSVDAITESAPTSATEAPGASTTLELPPVLTGDEPEAVELLGEPALEDVTALSDPALESLPDTHTETETDTGSELDTDSEAEADSEAERDIQAPNQVPRAGEIEPPLPPSDPVPTPGFSADPKSFLQSFQGKGEVSLFSGALSYQYPLWVPQGRLSMTPQLALTYSSSDSRYASPTGYGWSLPANAIYRIPRSGYDKLYQQNDYFGADLFGSSSELMIFDEATGLYKPKFQAEGQDFWYNANQNRWQMKDSQGNTYTFGSQEENRQADPEDSSRTYKWMLERVEDLNGNFMILTYGKNGGAIYPQAIRYTGHGNDEGLFEIRFVWENAPAYTDYKTGFSVTHAKRLDRIELYSYQSGEAELKLAYELEYNEVNSAVSLLSSIQVQAQDQSLPATEFDYFDGSENTADKKLHALKQIQLPYGGLYHYTYQPASAYRHANGTASNWIPFTTHTVKTQSVQAGENEPEYTASYDYRRGHYYFDELDAYRREYAGFGQVTVTDPEGSKQLLYFHQSEFDPGNEADSSLGEYQDHLSKKGNLYRQELRDANDVFLQESLSQWDREILPQGDSPEERSRPFLKQKVAVEHGQGEFKAKAMSFTSDAYGNPLQTVDYGEVTLLNPTGAFEDTGQDKVEQNNLYTQNTQKHLFSALTRSTQTSPKGALLAQTELRYDNLPWGQVEKGQWTARKDWINAQETLEQSRTVNALGQAQTMTNARGYTTELGYDDFDLYPKNVTNAKDQTSAFLYDVFFGQMIESTDPNGHTQAQELDPFGRVRTRFTEDSQGELRPTDAFFYQIPANPISITQIHFPGLTDKEGNSIEVTQVTYFDGLNRVIQSKQEAEGNQFVSVSQRYNSLGQLEASTLPVFRNNSTFESFNENTPQTSSLYDSLGRVVSQTSPVGTSTISYGAWSQTIMDGNGHAKGFRFDARGNLTQVTEHLEEENLETHYLYNLNNQLIGLTNAEGNTQSMAYDLLGRRLSQTLLHHPSDPSVAAYGFAYDENGNLLARTDAKGQSTTYVYDELDRLTSENAGEEAFLFNYDEGDNAIGRLSSIFGPNSSKWLFYDALGRVIKEKQKLQTGIYETEFTYAGTGAELSQLTYPNGLEVAYRYNNAGQLEEVTDYADNLDYGPHGAITRVDYANGVSTVNEYDPNKAYRMTGKTTTLGQSAYQDLAYTYDPVGNILELSESAPTALARTAAYSYDDLDRLTSASITAGPKGPLNLTFAYSPMGNILSKSDVGEYVYEDSHPQAVTNAGGALHAYDENGSLVSSPGMAHAYNARNQLVQTTQGEKATRYVYDEGGRRIQKITEGGTVTYISDLYEVNMDAERAFVMAGGLKLATVEEDSTTFSHLDHLSGASVSTDEVGEIVEQVDYLPYGSSRVEMTSPEYENDYLFTGQERDEETGLYYYGARYYDPMVGRFMGVDPILQERLSYKDEESQNKFKQFISNPQNLNAFSYVGNNPLKYIDPTGMLRVNTDQATKEEIKAFNKGLEALKDNVANNKRMQDYFQLYGVDINEILSNDKKGPVVNIGIPNSKNPDIGGTYNEWSNKINIYDRALGGTYSIMETLIHEVAHWANDVAKAKGNLNPSLKAFKDEVNYLNEQAGKDSKFKKTLHEDGFFGYITKPILLLLK